MRLCLPCLGNLWEGNRWIRDRSYASPEWDEALQRELREEFFNKTELRSTGLKKDQIDGIAHIRWFHQNNAHSRGSFSYEYKPTDVLLARWQIYGGQTGLDAKSAYEGEQANHDSGAEKSAYEGEQQTTIPVRRTPPPPLRRREPMRGAKADRVSRQAGYILKLPERRPRGMDRVVNGLFIGDLDEFADLEL
ncbi:hypothetical protein DFJ74DRAFT_655725 [Hyaloraphidium curvatum]|nr:hypothetical protein DFJ74DRAFT_655725 [Hyaloraphidium curvatum]